MESAVTYTKRVNARRAGVAAGIPSERVAITVHKDGDEVRFGWKESATPVKRAMTTANPQSMPKVPQEERNGVKRPKTGGVCAAVWAWLDANPGSTLKNAKASAPDYGWNPNNVACEFYQWRKFQGISGRTEASLPV
jgi:hypothetical protein